MFQIVSQIIIKKRIHTKFFMNITKDEDNYFETKHSFLKIKKLDLNHYKIL